MHRQTACQRSTVYFTYERMKWQSRSHGIFTQTEDKQLRVENPVGGSHNVKKHSWKGRFLAQAEAGRSRVRSGRVTLLQKAGASQGPGRKEGQRQAGPPHEKVASLMGSSACLRKLSARQGRCHTHLATVCQVFSSCLS